MIEVASSVQNEGGTDRTLVAIRQKVTQHDPSHAEGPFGTGATLAATTDTVNDRPGLESSVPPLAPEEEPFLPPSYSTSQTPDHDFYSNRQWYLESWKLVRANIRDLASNMLALGMNADEGYHHLSELVNHLKSVLEDLKANPEGLGWLVSAELAHTEMKEFSGIQGRDWGLGGFPWQPVRGRLLKTPEQYLRSRAMRPAMFDGNTISERSLSRLEKDTAHSGVSLTATPTRGSFQEATRQDDVSSKGEELTLP